jgi:hypothetical protein
MKTKKFNKKLTVNKVTIATLDGNEISRVMGGISGDVCWETYVCRTRLCTKPGICTMTCP